MEKNNTAEKDIKEYRKQYYQANKDKWKVIKHCDICNVDYNSSSTINHLHTKNHKIKILELQIKNNS